MLGIVGTSAVVESRDACVVDQYLDRPKVAFDLGYRLLAGIEVADIELLDGYAGSVAELLGRFVVAGVTRGHRVAGRLQPLADRFADAACTARDQSYSTHGVILL